MRILCALLLISSATAVSAPVRAVADGLVPHRATYTVAGYLLDDTKGRPVLKGSAEIEFSRYCGAWRIVHSLRYKGVVDGKIRSFRLTARIEQNSDGRGLTFRRTIVKDGRKSVMQGTAGLKPRANGEAFVEGPGGRVIVPLPKETVFPATYYDRLLHALGRDSEVRTPVFGYGQTGTLLNVRAVILTPDQSPDKPPKAEISAALRTKSLWLVRLRYFDGAYGDQQRTQGASMTVNGNGVQLTFEREQGWFLIKGRLTQATALVEKPCQRRDSASRLAR